MKIAKLLKIATEPIERRILLSEKTIELVWSVGTRISELTWCACHLILKFVWYRGHKVSKMVSCLMIYLFNPLYIFSKNSLLECNKIDYRCFGVPNFKTIHNCFFAKTFWKIKSFENGCLLLLYLIYNVTLKLKLCRGAECVAKSL